MKWLPALFELISRAPILIRAGTRFFNLWTLEREWRFRKELEAEIKDIEARVLANAANESLLLSLARLRSSLRKLDQLDAADAAPEDPRTAFK